MGSMLNEMFQDLESRDPVLLENLSSALTGRVMTGGNGMHARATKAATPL